MLALWSYESVGVTILLVASTPFLMSINGSREQKRQTAEELCRNKTDGYHPHPDDCEKYLWCSSGYGIILKCTNHEHYSVELGICTFPFVAKCQTSTFANILFNPNKNNNNLNNEGKNNTATETSTSTEKSDEKAHINKRCKRVVCSYTLWAMYGYGIAMQLTKHIDTSLCTHVVFSYAEISDNKLVSRGNLFDGLIYDLMDKKKSHPDLKTLLAVDGWNFAPEVFRRMMAFKSSRSSFINSCIEFMRKFDFEGLNLEWELTDSRGNPLKDKNRFSALVDELRIAFDNEDIPEGKSKLLLTAFVSAKTHKIDTSYDVAILNSNLDFINLMSYDYHGAWEYTVGHHSPLGKVKESAEYWVKKGFSRDKLVIGLPFYGRSFTIYEGARENHEAYARAGKIGRFSETPGLLSFYEICEKLQNNETAKYLLDNVNPYCVYEDQWVGYDDEESLQRKVEYILEGEFGGAMVMDLSYDDFRDQFCGKGKYPLLVQVNKACNVYSGVS